MDLLGYKNSVAVVTGCASGIGRATAELLMQMGAKVYGIDIQQPSYPLSHFIAADFCQPSSIDDALEKIDEPVNTLFNCAGLGPSHPDNSVIAVNVLATRYLTEQLVKKMPSGGAVVTVGSIGGTQWRQHIDALLEFLKIANDSEALGWFETHKHQFKDAYCFSKEAIAIWTKQSCTRLIQQGIRINCSAPGTTQTPMIQEIERELPDSNVDRVTFPIGRRSDPTEQAWALLMLNSDKASYINGVDLAVDGGAVAAQVAV